MAAIGTVGLLFFGFEDVETPALFGGVALVWLVIGIGLRLLGLGRSAPEGTRTSPDISPATVWLGLSLVLLAVGGELGFWLVLIAAGMVAVGIGGLVRELRAQRQAGEVTGT
jgi:hypothetical protein